MFLYLLPSPLMSFIVLLSFLSSLLHSFTLRSCFLFSFSIVLCRAFIGFSISPSFVFRSISFFFLYLCIFLYIFLLLYLIFAKSILGVVCFSFFLYPSTHLLLSFPCFLYLLFSDFSPLANMIIHTSPSYVTFYHLPFSPLLLFLSLPYWSSLQIFLSSSTSPHS